MEWLLSILFVTHQFFGGNFDLFYIMASLLILKDILFFRYRNISTTFIFLLPIIIIYILQILMLHDLNVEKGIASVGKMFLCLYLLNTVKNNFSRIDVTKLYKYAVLLLMLLFVISLFVKTDVFWIFNDLTNKFLTTRLKLLYIEPSELSFHAAVLALFILFYNNNCEKLFINYENLLYLVILLVIMAYSGGLGGIVLVLFTVIFILGRDNLKKSTVGRKIIYIYVILCMIPIIFIFVNYFQSSIVLRLQAIMSGSDSSFNYRVFKGFNGMKACLESNPFLGIGFGNLNTDYYEYMLLSYGLVSKIANSFMYAIAEGGLLLLFYLGCLFVYMWKHINKDTFKYALLIFIFLYQIGGGYFTNPINWIIYGVILSNSAKERSEVS
ncbi:MULTISPECIES: O-antigen polymerase [Clostridium]|uniref:O-Antigen ligase n=4 Tax=Clostridium TaxID=1485 RepID=A0A166STB7_9CLOT|nr:MULTISPECIES: O-antigen polymerase [Clostridium]OVY48679.1 hypothetical protein WX72_00319 [Clostridium autoethanogenum]ALU36983.1 O-antigen polymerase [Clostridium autoethanogenum DSM 10061]OAA84548.1 hypothetical protein WX45_01016 [Clostridium ljungdahlii DSM 13528]OAA92748.1 hypothetical protein WX73_00632 [Clostridium coskatii]OBR97719.1 hypothetical protein CLCOS_00760 [Clostridium coskatii]